MQLKVSYLFGLPTPSDYLCPDELARLPVLNYKTLFFNQLSFSVNQLFFYTRINQPLLMEVTRMVNVNGYLIPKVRKPT